jgi:hypothetical protein
VIDVNTTATTKPLSRPALATKWRTLHHLRSSQWLWRARYMVERRSRLNERSASRWSWTETAAPRVRIDLPCVPVLHQPGARGAKAVELLAAGDWEQLGQTQRLGYEQPDWRLGSVRSDRLWTVTLHYHAWAYALAEVAAAKGPDASKAEALLRHYVADWIGRCGLTTPGGRDLAWNSYAIATRLGWWARIYRVLGSARMRGWGTEHDEFLRSMWQQAAYLRNHLEWDLRGNHLMRDAVGLAWAGRFFDEPAAREWLKTSTTLAVEQADEQVLPDGGHFERSPMYHLHVMEDLASLAMLVEDREAKARLRGHWQRMAEYLAWSRHPDGQISCFNDAAFDSACEPQAMLDLSELLDDGALGPAFDRAPRQGGRYFADTGIVIWHGEPWSLFLDIGPVGPDYQPGHAHADTLSIECSYRGERIFVDPGTYGYDHDARREYDRSTAAHNTVVVDDESSSEVWHIFRVGRRAYPCEQTVSITSDGLTASSTHNGYEHLAGRPRPSRTVSMAGQGRLTISDQIDGTGEHVVEGGYLLAPEWQAEQDADGWLLCNGPLRVRLKLESSQRLKLHTARRPYHPRFGEELLTTRLVWRYAGPLPLRVTTSVEGQ